MSLSSVIAREIEEFERLFRELKRALLEREFELFRIPFELGYVERTWFFEPVIPVFEVREDENEVRIYVNLPGFRKENVKLRYVYDWNSLLIEGFREIEGEKKQVKYVIPITWKYLDIEKTNAYYRDGLLIIRIPRKQPSTREIKIE